jgi:competence ComEA-like helix-hairpin-helix protein
MNENQKDYFYFSRSEKNGILVLIVIIFLLIVFPYFQELFHIREKPINQAFEKEIQYFAQSLQETEKEQDLEQNRPENHDDIALFYFDPNHTSEEEYKRLGFTERQIRTIHNYVQKGGRFFIKDDFKKIYGISEQQYERVRHYIQLPDHSIPKNPFEGEVGGKLKRNQSESNLFQFDPNTASNEDFLKLGLTDANIRTIRNYQKKIGKFKIKEEFKKVYGITEEKYKQLEPYIFIHEANEETQEKKRYDLNSASVEELIGIKGIGQYTAEAIVQYRDKLGGYVDIGQLLEIKNITPEMLERIRTSIFADKSSIKIIRLNFAEVGELAAHPYLNYQQSKEIVKFRSIHGPFQDKIELLQNKILLEQSYKKIEAYLSTE